MSASATFDRHYLSRTFWSSPEIHLAASPHHTLPPQHLLETAKPHLPEGGCLFLTSGTTGAPKWVALEKRAFLHSAKVVNAHYGLTREDRWLLALPLHHVGGFSILARACLTESEVSQAPAKWQVDDFVASLTASESTVTSLVPTQVHDLVTAQVRPPSRLRLVLVGGGRISPALLRDALNLGWPVCATFGMTEAASQIASQPLEHDRFESPDTLEVLPHWHLTTDAEDILTLQGPSLAKGYLVVYEGGTLWEPIDPTIGLKTRDRVKLLQDGARTFLNFLSRHENVVKINGELVSLEPLEERLAAILPRCCPPFALAALPDARRENRIVLVIESQAPAPDESVAGALAEHNTACAPHERIDSIRLLPKLPRTELGKLARSRLSDYLGHQSGSSA